MTISSLTQTLCFAATICSVCCLAKSRTGDSLLVPLSRAEPNPVLFPPKKRYPLEPRFTEVEGPKQTNKFWNQWSVDKDNAGYSIYPSPYTLKFNKVKDSMSGRLNIMKGETDYQGSFFTTHWRPDFAIGAVESFAERHTIVKEGHFGVHVEVRPGPDSNCKMTYPVYAGMAYPTAKYESGCTPVIESDYGLKLVEKVKPGVWRFQKNYQPVKEYRVYVLQGDGSFVDDSYDFNSNGQLNKELDGWVRLADLQVASDAQVLDKYANTILVGWELEVKEGVVQYNFETVGPQNAELLHWAYANHHFFLSGNGQSVESTLTRTRSPVKGEMWPIVSGKQWTMTVDLKEALALGFLPPNEPRLEHVAGIKLALERDWVSFKEAWRFSMHRIDHYFSGKGFQKLGQICHMLSKYKNPEYKECAGILKQGFQCMYSRNVSDGSDRRRQNDWGEDCVASGCWWSPKGTWYDLDWKGIASRWDDSPICGLDFGNSCFNDHHYHWGYYVVTAAMLVDLDPSMKNDKAFVDFINMYIRDAANPSTEDTYFPQFRAFDWFDMHSWSRGLVPHPNGKDQESTSEEVNLHFGVMLWGRVLGDDRLEKLGATMLATASQALKDYFLNKNDSPNYPPSFSKFHVTGIFFQNMVELTTWFGNKKEYIHGIQMLPLSSAILLSRKPDFAWEEWYDVLSKIRIDYEDRWWSILLTGNMALHSPAEAWDHLSNMGIEAMDDGLTKSWALYWTSCQQGTDTKPTNVPTPAPPPGGGPGGPPTCNPDQGQMCPPGDIPCPPSGQCPGDAPAPPPGQSPAPGPPATPPPPMCNPNTTPKQKCPGPPIYDCPDCGREACECFPPLFARRMSEADVCAPGYVPTTSAPTPKPPTSAPTSAPTPAPKPVPTTAPTDPAPSGNPLPIIITFAALVTVAAGAFCWFNQRRPEVAHPMQQDNSRTEMNLS